MKVKVSNELYKEVITSENVLKLSEMIAIVETKYLIGWVGYAMIEIHKNLIKDVLHKNESNYVLTESYDLVQQVALLLFENIGKRLSDTHHVDNKGKVITIQMQACKEIAKITNYKCRRFKTDISLEVITENQLSKEDTFETDVDYEESYEKVNDIISNLSLNEQQTKTLQCRINGMSYTQIAKVIQRAVSTTYDCLKSIQKRYMSIYN